MLARYTNVPTEWGAGMSKGFNKLTDAQVKAAKPREDGKPKKMADGGGLVLLVRPSERTSGKVWQVRYRFEGKANTLSLGPYPHVSLAAARVGRDEALANLRRGVNPSAKMKAAKLQPEPGATVGSIARDWLECKRPEVKDSTYDKNKWLLSLVEGSIGRLPADQVTPPQLMSALRTIEKKGTYETAKRLAQVLHGVFHLAFLNGFITSNPAVGLTKGLTSPVQKSRAAITDPAKIGALLRAIDGYEGRGLTRLALQLAPLVFVRPGELRHMEWAEVDFERAEWRIPGAKMKMNDEHVVPLSRQALEILEKAKEVTVGGSFVFPSVRTSQKAMSDNTLNAALRSLGFSKEEMTAHGFRAMASTRLNEMGWNTDVIERQLAHAQRNKVRAAYNRAQYMDDRREMMQSWSDYLDELRAGRLGPARPDVNMIREPAAGLSETVPGPTARAVSGRGSGAVVELPVRTAPKRGEGEVHMTVAKFISELMQPRRLLVR